MKYIAFISFMALSTCCLSQQNLSMEMTKFVHPHFSFQYPSSWTIDTSKSYGEEVTVFSPLENEEDKFSENVNVLIQPMEGQAIDLEMYKEITEQQIANYATDGNIIESSVVRTDRGEMFKITYAMTQGPFKLKITSICYIYNDHAYLVTFSSVFEKYDQYIKTATEILDSFTLTR